MIKAHSGNPIQDSMGIIKSHSILQVGAKHTKSDSKKHLIKRKIGLGCRLRIFATPQSRLRGCGQGILSWFVVWASDSGLFSINHYHVVLGSPAGLG